MHKIQIPAVMSALLLAVASTAWPDDLASIKQALQAKYALTTTTADKTDIVTPGAVLVLKKSNLVTVDVKSKNLYQNHYRNGRIDQNSLGKSVGWMKRLPGASAGAADRTFVSGEKVWLTNIEVKEQGVVFTLYTDAYNDTRFEATLQFPFEKGSTPTAAGVASVVGEVFDVQPSDDKGKQDVAAGGQPASAPVPAGAPAPAAAPAAVPPPIAPPPPPPADPKVISLGQTPDQVTANFGQPDKVIKLGAKQIYVYKDMKVTFVAGKVSDVQ